MNEHEQAFATECVLAERRERYLGFLASAKHRRKFRDRISHALVRDLDARYLYEEDRLPPPVARRIRNLLGRVGQADAPCHVMCDDATLDGLDMTLGEAEARWDSLCGIIISVVPGKLVYYRPERPDKNYVLFKE